MENLPIEILETIFSWLPSLSTPQCKRVCKTWRTVIGKSKVGLLFQFRGEQLQNLCYTDRVRFHEDNLENFDSGKTLTNHLDTSKERLSIQALVFNQQIVGSCNGLVCFLSLNTAADHYEGFIICNPITGEYVFLQRVDGAICVKRKDLKFGFGYLHSTNEYKIVRTNCNRKTIHVYTLGSGFGWRIIKDKRPYLLQSSSIFCTGGIFANGAIHLLESIKAWENQIVAFDLADEKFKSVPSPNWEHHHVYALNKLEFWGGNLCVVSRYINGYGGRLDIWAFKKAVNGTRVLLPAVVAGQDYYDDMWSWNKEFSISYESTEWYNPFGLTENNEVLLWITKFSSDESEPIYMCCYSPKTSTLRRSSHAYYRKTGSYFPEIIPHMNTLVSLKEIGEC